MKNKNKLKNYLKTDIKYEPIKQERKPYYMHSVEKHGNIDVMSHVWVFLAFIGLLAIFGALTVGAILLFKGGI